MRTGLNLRANLAKKSDPIPFWTGGVVVRTLFIIILVVITARVASPQTERISSVLETPGDFIRVILGLILCTWFVAQVFVLPKDAAAYRIWLYLGLAVLPLSLLCAVIAW